MLNTENYKPKRKVYQTKRGHSVEVLLYAGGPYFRYQDLVRALLNNKANHPPFSEKEFRYFLFGKQRTLFVNRAGLLVMIPQAKDCHRERVEFLTLLVKKFGNIDPDAKGPVIEVEPEMRK